MGQQAGMRKDTGRKERGSGETSGVNSGPQPMSIVMPGTSATGGLNLQQYHPKIEKSDENT